MGDQAGADAKFAAPQDDGMPTPPDNFAESLASAALERWVLNFEPVACGSVPAQRSEMSCTG